MSRDDFHDKPFDESTLTKLDIFELYVREWLPVFLKHPHRPEIHLYDFFSGPGTDSDGTFGSPLRILKQLQDYRELIQSSGVTISVHLFDEDPDKIRTLEQKIDQFGLRLPGIQFDVRPLAFAMAFQQASQTLANPQAAKLLLIDQFGVDHVTESVFRQLAGAPTTDFLFFLSSSTLHRFRDHPAIKQKITRPDDYYQVHLAALNYYRALLPSTQSNYFLSPFSIKKGSNIYGVIFGSAHPLGMDKFLQVAWAQDGVNGEADFDIHRDHIQRDQIRLPLAEFRPSKLRAFESDLEQRLRAGRLANEADVVRVCFEHGVKRQHATGVLKRLKDEGAIQLQFRVPNVRMKDPRPIRTTNPGQPTKSSKA